MLYFVLPDFVFIILFFQILDLDKCFLSQSAFEEGSLEPGEGSTA